MGNMKTIRFEIDFSNYRIVPVEFKKEIDDYIAKCDDYDYDTIDSYVTGEALNPLNPEKFTRRAGDSVYLDFKIEGLADYATYPSYLVDPCNKKEKIPGIRKFEIKIHYLDEDLYQKFEYECEYIDGSPTWNWHEGEMESDEDSEEETED